MAVVVVVVDVVVLVFTFSYSLSSGKRSGDDKYSSSCCTGSTGSTRFTITKTKITQA